jgi:putative ABC transport system permease protein
MVVLPRLHKKLFRDIRSAKVQFGAVSFVILLGITIYVCSYAAYLNLDISYQKAYRDLKMADYWISFDYISQTATRDLNKIPGVTAEGRIVRDLSVRMAKETGENITGRVVSMPPHDQPEVNSLKITDGSYFGATPNREILVEKHFADYHNLKPGDRLTLGIEKQNASFEIKGIVISPEYLWVAKSSQEPFPPPRTFGIFYLVHATAEELFSMQGMHNEITLIFDDTIDHSATLEQVNRILRRYEISRVVTKDEASSIEARKTDISRGARTAYMIERKDQLSNDLLKQDLDGFRQMAFMFPMLFLTMAALTIYVLLNRLIEAQRIQIGLMKAIGYGKAKILFHYIGYSLFVGLAGSIPGILLGNLLAGGFTEMYIEQLGIPIAVIQPHPEVLIIGLLVGIIVPVISGIMPAWMTTRIRPAEAMRSAPPAKGRRTILEILFPFLSNLPYIIKLPMRNIFRNFRRTLFMAMGVASAVLLTLVSLSFVDAMDNLMDVFFNRVQRYDAVVHLEGMGTVSTARYISHLPGIKQAEAILEMPYRIRYGDRVSDSSIMGLEEGRHCSDSSIWTATARPLLPAASSCRTL